MTDEQLKQARYELRKKDILRRKKYHWSKRIEMKKALKAAIADMPRVWAEIQELHNKEDL